MKGWRRNQKSVWQRKKRIKTWWLVALFIIFFATSIFSLRNNNLKMIKLRNQVLVVDKNNGDTTEALKQLNYHVFHHMNTEIVRPIELVNSYNRQAKAVIEKANRLTNRDIYAEATAACEQRGIPLTSIAQCAADYAISHNTKADATKIVLPNKDLFTYTFQAPLWTPDLAGFALLLTVVIALWLLARLIEYIAVRLVLRQRLKSGF